MGPHGKLMYGLHGIGEKVANKQFVKQIVYVKGNMN
jgi:hypothetical protein